MQITTVLFDVGGVVVRTPFELVPLLEQQRGLARGALQLDGPFTPGGDARYERVLSGDEDEFLFWQDQANRLRDLLGLVGEDPTQSLIATLFEAAEGDLVRPGIWPTLDTLQGFGIRTGVLSNHLALFHHPEAISDVIARFEPVIDLSYAAILKPDPRAFENALEVLGEPDPATVCHVDDLPVHVAGAEAAGLRGFRFDPLDPSGSFTRLVEVVQQ